MHVLLTGATGYIGSAVLKGLIQGGHSVTALVRTEDAADRLRGTDVDAAVGDMRDAGFITALAQKVDAVIHTATTGDGHKAAAERTLTDAVIAGLGDTGKPFIRTGGILVYGQGEDITEASPRRAPSFVAWRDAMDIPTLQAPGIRSILIEPGVAYGYGHGIPNLVSRAEITEGDGPALILLGEGNQHWTTVHVDDLAALYILALEKAPHGSTYLGVNGHNPTARELGEAASRVRGLGGRVAPETAAETIARLGAFGEALLLSQQATGRAARELGWTPTRPTLIDEINAGTYTN
ncbi:NAD-dependent epimerase/dehydratase family protein [Arthrobacter zhaoguopingii]|uniref:NAD-dependent epimerase/dehydratase family protein n=1 Tax=Arthrobacter zhaoguopingii TaxID=2681491 RepID=UPI00135CC59B|nr:NAD-dependent epimerase/dehydratase family protein [Arthrobacter zhaoguopingii]